MPDPRTGDGENERRKSGPGPAVRVLLVKGFFNEPGITQMGHPLGIMSIAAVLRRDFGYDVRILDMRLEGRDYDRLEESIRELSPHFVGISGQSSESVSLAEIAASAKKVDPKTVVVIGGPHSTAYGETLVANPNIDYAVAGEGEIIVGKLIERLTAGRDASDLPGLKYLRDGELVDTGRADHYDDLDRLPMPAYDLVPVFEYKQYDRFSRTGRGDYMTIFSSRACPYNCIYCHDIFGKKLRARSAESLFGELEHLYSKYGIREFEIVDDVFNIRRGRVLEFCDRIIESGMRISIAFPNGLRGDLLDREVLEKLERAGTRYISFAVETASPRMQKLIRKNLDLEKVERNISIARSLRIHSHGFFMIGLPGETLEEMSSTVDFILSSELHTFNLFTATPYRGTRMGEMAEEMGRSVVTDFNQDYYSKGFVNMTDVPAEEINRLRRKALVGFYAKPSRMIGILRDFPGEIGPLKLFRIFVRRMLWKT